VPHKPRDGLAARAGEVVERSGADRALLGLELGPVLVEGREGPRHLALMSMLALLTLAGLGDCALDCASELDSIVAGEQRGGQVAERRQLHLRAPGPLTDLLEAHRSDSLLRVTGEDLPEGLRFRSARAEVRTGTHQRRDTARRPRLARHVGG
jgi:hypothetical protein